MGIRTAIRQRRLLRRAVGENVTVGTGFSAGPNVATWAPRALLIGNDVYIGRNSTIQVDGIIGDGVLIANNVGIVGRTDHDISELGTTIRRSSWVGNSPERLSRRTVIGSDVWIGFGAVILSGVTIGDSSIVAAGSVVTRDVDSNCIVAGAPASKIGSRFSEDEFLEHWVRLRRSAVRPVSEL